MKISKKTLNPLFYFFILVFLVLGCNEKAEENTITETAIEPVFNLETAKSEIEAANNEFKAFIASADSVGLSNLYTQDTKVMMTGAPAISGRENVQSIFSGIMNSGITSANLKTIEVWGTEDLITEEGEYTLYAGDDIADQGKYIVLWKNVDGNWKLHRDIFNSDIPAN